MSTIYAYSMAACPGASEPQIDYYYLHVTVAVWSVNESDWTSL